MKKSLKLMLAGLALATCAFGFAACGGGGDNNNENNNNNNNNQGGDNNNNNNNSGTPIQGTEYVFEAEYTDMDDLSGAGSSNSAEGTNMIQAASKASNGHYIGFTHKKGLTITFEITSDKDTAADLKVGLAPLDGMNAIRIRPGSFIVKVNGGDEINYAEQNVAAGRGENSMNQRSFDKYNIGTVNLHAGLNTITLTIGDNDFVNGGSGGPAIDAIYLTAADAELTMDEFTDNIG